MGGSLFRIYISIFGLLLGGIFALDCPAGAIQPQYYDAARKSGRGGGRRLSSRRGNVGGARRRCPGDLWAESAFTYADLEWADTTKVEGQMLDEAKASATKAVSLKPGNSDVWLMLADLSSHFRRQTPNPTECLKMSYYTGPHEDRLIPLRLMIAARIDLSADAVLADLFRRELETAIIDRTALRPAVVAAYQQATSQAQHLIEDVAARTDPAFSQALRPEIRH